MRAHSLEGVRRRRRFTAEDRRRLVEAWRRSGLSQNRFAKEHGIDASYLSRWKTEFPSDASADLVRVEVIDERKETRPPQSRAFELRFPSGVEITVPMDFDDTALARVISTLRC